MTETEKDQRGFLFGRFRDVSRSEFMSELRTKEEEEEEEYVRLGNEGLKRPRSSLSL